MDDDQPSPPSAPWVSRSAWSLAPALFFYELLLGLVWLFTLGFLFDLLFLSITMLPALVFFVYQIGAKCATEELAPKVPRRRIWGASFLLSLIQGLFLFLLFKGQLDAESAQHPEQFQKFMDTIIASSKFNPEEVAELTPAGLRSIIASFFAMLLSLGLFLLHLLSLWVGVRSVEKVRS
jgi:hypothetical protein